MFTRTLTYNVKPLLDDHADNERAPPLTKSQYAQTFKALAETRSNSEYDIATKIAGQMIEQQGSNSPLINLKPVEYRDCFGRLRNQAGES